MLNYLYNLYTIHKLNIVPKQIIIVTGAGISIDSGIFNDINQSFYGSKDIFKKVAFKDSFIKNPEEFKLFYTKKRKEIQKCHPNKAHLYLAKLENHYKVNIVTQNIDDLHERGGSHKLIKVHGSIWESICSHCQSFSDQSLLSTCSICQEGIIRPNVVLINENIKSFDHIKQIINESDLYIQIGTSNRIEPTASIVKNFDGYRININTNKEDLDQYFDLNLYGKAVDLVPLLVKKLIKNSTIYKK